MAIDLYTWGTPNGKKISIMLEEVGLPYAVHKIDITKGDQHTPAYLAINPNGKIPAIVDPQGPEGGPLAVFESGAILTYLAEKTGKLLPTTPVARMTVLEWLMFQMAGLGPMAGQTHHFRRFAPEKIPYAIDRYSNETKRIYGVMNTRLEAAPYLAGDYSIADIACYPWIARHEWQGLDLAAFPALKRWYDAIGARPAVAKGMAVPG
jgi:GSH-dependent disulfide-bond oxidoreductase